MKKDLDWVIQEIHATRKVLADSESSGNETADEFTFNNGKEEGLVIALKLLDQLDEPETLSKKWIDEHRESTFDLDLDEDFETVFIKVEDLQNLLVPTLSEMETVEITEEPETVADVISTFWKSLERLKEVMSMEVEELEE